MLIMTIVFFLCAGLYLLGEAVRRIWLMEWAQMNPTPIVPESDEESENDDGPKLTKLGRPITEIKLSA